MPRLIKFNIKTQIGMNLKYQRVKIEQTILSPRIIINRGEEL